MGSLLWNIAINWVLERPLENNSEIIAYADDFVVLSGVARTDTAIKKIERKLSKLTKWATRRGLSFLVNKSQTVCLKEVEKVPSRSHLGME